MGDELTSWKEIAAHLKVSVRTAQNWEAERGLPVRRLPGPRGRVAASVADLDAWLQQASPEKTAFVKARAWLWLAAVSVLLLIVAAAYWLMGRVPAAPASIGMQGQRLIATDKRGRVVFERTFADLDLISYGLRARLPNPAALVDLNGDSRPEVLFAHLIRPQAGIQGSLVAFNGNGEILWRVVPGRPVKTAAREFNQPHVASEFGVARIDGQTRVFLTSDNNLYWPSQILMLSSGGKVLDEYWHGGALTRLRVSAFQGRTLVYAGGVANAHRQAELVVLDPHQFGGASEENASYQILGFPRAREAARLLFPRSCINHALSPYGRVTSLTMVEKELIVGVLQNPEVGRYAEIYYHLDPELNVRSVVFSEDFLLQHRQMRTRRQLDHDFGREEAEALRRLTRLR